MPKSLAKMLQKLRDLIGRKYHVTAVQPPLVRPLATFLDKIICKHLYYEIVITIAYNSMYF